MNRRDDEHKPGRSTTKTTGRFQQPASVRARLAALQRYLLPRIEAFEAACREAIGGAAVNDGALSEGPH